MNNLNTHLSCTPGAVRFGQTLVLNTIHTIVNRETILLFSIAFLKKSFDYKSLFQLHDINWTDVLAYNPPTLAFKVFVSIFKLCQGVKLEISSLKKKTKGGGNLQVRFYNTFFPFVFRFSAAVHRTVFCLSFLRRFSIYSNYIERK